MKTEKEKIFVFGASGHAKVVIDIIEKQGLFVVACLVDDALGLAGKEVYGYPVIGGREEILAANIKKGIVAIGNNGARCAVADWLISKGINLVSVAHPSAQIARGVSLGGGTVIMAGAVVNSDTIIGRNVIINTKAGIDHDCVVGDGVHIAPGATLCGTVRVGNGAFIGAGAIIAPNISVGNDSTVGAGATVLHNISSNVTAVGTPARIKI